ncbi:hypothetical protein LL668_06840 [Providencia rettgeri]|uniref:hypothetical protein n=1 Tax=Providencia rettgeri TaxID=587 RepID=UPI001E43BBC4|nr:hypothetical protein [Providencia rettgeri]UEK60847.1 hypothetical protein LL668_06840 [Providencia rettgeri]
MGKNSKMTLGKMRQKIKESKIIAAKEALNMRYNSKPLDITVSVPSSNIRWGTKR